jgi:Methyltransferase domain
MALKQQMKRLIRTTFEVGQRFKVDILPRHFYSEIPSIPLLRTTTAWRKPLIMTHLAGSDLATQQAFVAACTQGLQSDLTATSIHTRACQMNNLPEGFGPTEADFLYCFVRSQQPPRIIQIGCGVSTAICLIAAADAGYTPEIICIEPYPTQFLIDQAQAGTIRLVKEKFEDSSLPLAELLEGGGLFFVDSSHTLGPAGEVTRLICETLPTLPAGTWVHFHDIRFPYDYPPDILTSELFFCHETALLHAFLLMNNRYTIAASLSMLHHADPASLAACLPNYRPAKFDQGLRLTDGHHPSSIFMRVS